MEIARTRKPGGFHIYIGSVQYLPIFEAWESRTALPGCLSAAGDCLLYPVYS
jgi:hypothetical protein